MRACKLLTYPMRMLWVNGKIMGQFQKVVSDIFLVLGLSTLASKVVIGKVTQGLWLALPLSQLFVLTLLRGYSHRHRLLSGLAGLTSLAQAIWCAHACTSAARTTDLSTHLRRRKFVSMLSMHITSKDRA